MQHKRMWNINYPKIKMSYSTPFQKRLDPLHVDDFHIDHDPSKSPNDRIFEKHLLWLGYLLCRGNFSDVFFFLSKQSNDVVHRYLNETSTYFCGGTVLHMLLLWNSNIDNIDDVMSPLDVYKAFRKMGAALIMDKYGNMPCNENDNWWIAPNRKLFGRRNGKEFIPLYQKIIEWETRQEKFYDWTETTQTRAWDWKSDPCICGLYGIHMVPLSDCDC